MIKKYQFYKSQVPNHQNLEYKQWLNNTIFLHQQQLIGLKKDYIIKFKNLIHKFYNIKFIINIKQTQKYKKKKENRVNLHKIK